MTIANSGWRRAAACDVGAFSMTALLMTQSLTGCAAAPAPAAPSARIIVRFAAATTDPTDPAFLAGLARATRVTRFDPIRPMSGDAYVMTLVCGDDPCDAAIARIATNPAVVAIERDAKMRTQ